MLTKREKWLMQQAYEAGKLDTDLWYLIKRSNTKCCGLQPKQIIGCISSAEEPIIPNFNAWLGELTHMDEEGSETGTIEQFLDEEAPR